MNLREQIFDMLIRFSYFFDAQPTKERLMAYTEELCKYDPVVLKKAFDDIKKTCDRFPSLSQIFKLVDPPVDPKLEANDLAGEIISCISQLGPYRSDEVRQRVGEVGWFAIERFGGWSHLCDSQTKDMPAIRAQLRDICSMSLDREKRGESLQISFNEKREGRLTHVSDLQIEFNQGE